MRRNRQDEGELVTKHHGNLLFLPNPSGGPGTEYSEAQVVWSPTPFKEGPEVAMTSRGTTGTYLEEARSVDKLLMCTNKKKL